MQIKDWIVGTIDLRFISANPHAILNYLTQNGVMIKRVRWIDDLIFEITVYRNNLKIIKTAEKKFQCDVSIIKQRGVMSYGSKISQRIILVSGLILFVILSIYIQNHILFIDVIGNSTISSRAIIEKSGLQFGGLRKHVRSEQIKNNLLENIPELQWVGINTSGCVATISVRERTESEQTLKQDYSPASIVAVRDGTVCKITASKGTVLCQLGQQVSTGDTLISGMNLCGDIMLLTRAEGEIYADTNRELELKTILPTAIRGKQMDTEQRFGIIFEKNLIKLFKDSGILDTTCVKIGKRYDLRLPRGYTLPISLYCETISYHKTTTPQSAEYDIEWLLDQGSSYISRQMIAGLIVKQEHEIFTDRSAAGYRVRYCCTEMIGQIKKEELFCINGKNS